MVTSCRVVDGGVIASQELQIRRGGCDPVVAARFASSEPVADPFGLCSVLAQRHVGKASSVAGVFQRLGVTPDGSGVAFEISNAFQLAGHLELAPEQQGFFYVRADGTGLRRLGPPSREPVYWLYPGDAAAGYSAGADTSLSIIPDGRLATFIDVGPGPDGVETEQVFTLDLESGERRQLTHLTGVQRTLLDSPRVSPPSFWSGKSEWIAFVRSPDGNSQHGEFTLVHPDGSGFTPTPPSDNPGGNSGTGHVTPRFGLSPGGRFGIDVLPQPGTPHDAALLPGTPVYELFSNVREGHIQLTNLGNADINWHGVKNDAVLFSSAADPFGTNRQKNCQLFRVSPYGWGLRQLTNFSPGARAAGSCESFGTRPGCAFTTVNNGIDNARRARSYVFYSDCDPFGTNPDGSQAFALDWDTPGRSARLRQLTHATGTRMVDGALVAEFPGPVAVGGR